MSAIPLNKVLEKLPAAERAAIQRRARKLVAKYLTLLCLGDARRMTRKASGKLRHKWLG